MALKQAGRERMRLQSQIPDAASRRPVWVALADLYLDTELRESDVQHMAAVLAASPFSWREILEINYEEVAPALWFNLQSVAGEWAGWNEEWLVKRIAAGLSHKRRRTLGFVRLWRWRVDSYTRRDLNRVAAHLF